jgi:hypothetical protein
VAADANHDTALTYGRLETAHVCTGDIGVRQARGAEHNYRSTTASMDSAHASSASTYADGTAYARVTSAARRRASENSPRR